MDDFPKNKSSIGIRNVALDCIIFILEDKRPLHKVLSERLETISDRKDRAFLSRLIRGCTERAYSLDIIIDRISNVKVKKQKPVIRNILRLGAYQILFMDSVADFAAVNESVKLAGKRGFKNLGGFVNGVLRNICRKREEFIGNLYIDSRDTIISNNVDLKNEDTISSISFKYSVPDWLTEEFCSLYGKEAAVRSFKYFLEKNRIPVRVNESKISLSDFESEIGQFIDEHSQTGSFDEGEGSKLIKLEKNGILKGCYYIDAMGSVEDIPDFKEGAFVVQDMSSSLVGTIAGKLLEKKNIKSGLVLDLCAAPGGKSIHMADLGATVTACDISPQKTELIKEASKRCGFNNIETRVNDASVYNPEFEAKYDLVICDLPCSGLGIIGKKPDIKYNACREKIGELSSLQKSILKNAVRYVKPDGFLIFSTCTVTAKENSENADFIRKELGLRCIDLKDYLPEGIQKNRPGDMFLQLLPGKYGSDGFFISAFQAVRNSEGVKNG